jgi:hypothetical protein
MFTVEIDLLEGADGPRHDRDRHSAKCLGGYLPAAGSASWNFDAPSMVSGQV